MDEARTRRGRSPYEGPKELVSPVKFGGNSQRILDAIGPPILALSRVTMGRP